VVSACPVPLVAIGGEKKAKERDVLEMVQGIMDAGAYGVSMGRNIFQYKKPGNMIKAVSDIVHKGVSVQNALKILEKAPIISAIISTDTPIW
jgi:DhnA family fructose-bisphosphate aldolase class Ia